MTDNTFTLDGVSIEFEAGDTIMDAALRSGAYIPHLCHNPEFEPHGSCRVCLVELNGRHLLSHDYSSTLLSENDRLEVILPAAGG